MTQPPKKLLDQVRDAVWLKHYAYSTENTHVGWIKRQIVFHDVRHPAEMDAAEVEAFLIHLAVKENVVDDDAMTVVRLVAVALLIRV